MIRWLTSLLLVWAMLPSISQAQVRAWVETEVPDAVNSVTGNCAAVGDFNNDGLYDAAVGGAVLQWTEGSAHTVHHVAATASSGFTACDAADMDGDGDWDIIAADSIATVDTTQWYENPCNPDTFRGGCTVPPTGTWTLHTVGTTAGAATTVTYVAASDVDFDGEIDIVVRAGTEQPAIWYNDTADAWTLQQFNTALPCQAASSGFTSVLLEEPEDRVHLICPGALLRGPTMGHRVEANWTKIVYASGAWSGNYHITTALINDVATELYDIFIVNTGGGPVQLYLAPYPDITVAPWVLAPVPTPSLPALSAMFGTFLKGVYLVEAATGDVHRIYMSQCGNTSSLVAQCPDPPWATGFLENTHTLAIGGISAVETGDVLGLGKRIDWIVTGPSISSHVIQQGSISDFAVPGIQTAQYCDGTPTFDKQDRDGISGPWHRPVGRLYDWPAEDAGANGGPCASGTIAPGVAATAGHCTRTIDIAGCPPSTFNLLSKPLSALITENVTNVTHYYRRVVDPQTLPDYTCNSFKNDFALYILHPGDTFTNYNPEVWPAYNYATEAADCLGTITYAGGGSSGDTMVEYWQDTIPGIVDEKINVYCTNYACEFKSGWSGGPAYAIVDTDGPGGADPIPRYMGALGGGVPADHTLAHDYQAWIDSVIAQIPPVYANLSFGMSLDDFYLIVDRSNVQDLALGSKDLICHVDASTTGAALSAIGCEFHNTDSGQRVSCSDTTGIAGAYECSVTLPQYSSGNWRVRQMYLRNTLGERVVLKENDLYVAGVAFLDDLGVSGSAAAATAHITFIDGQILSSMAPNHKIMCIGKYVFDGLEDLPTAMSCSLSSAGQRNLHCITDTIQQSLQPGLPYALVEGFCTAPSWPTHASTWDFVSVAGLDLAGARATPYYGTGNGNEIYSCTMRPVDVTATAAWATLDTPDLYSSFVAQVWVLPSVQDEHIIGWLDSTLVGVPATSIADLALAVRFRDDLGIDVWNGATWESSASVTYTPGVWHQIRITGSATRIAVPVDNMPYSVSVAACSGVMELVDDSVFPAYRPQTALTHMVVYSDATISVSDWDTAAMGCASTSCFFENLPTPGVFGWDCGSPPDGCGGTVSDAPCAPNDCSPVPGDTCGGGGTPYVCGQ